MFIGSINPDGIFDNKPELRSFKIACESNSIQFYVATETDFIKHVNSIYNSYMAPVILGKWQCEKDYIPDRIFKNISCGQMGITNSKAVYDLFKGKIVYNPDSYQLFFDTQARLKNLTQEELFELMDFVKEKHTYLDRIDRILNFYRKTNIKSNQQL